MYLGYVGKARFYDHQPVSDQLMIFTIHDIDDHVFSGGAGW